MKKKSNLLFILMLLFSSGMMAQKDKPTYEKFTEKDYQTADAGKDADYLSDKEKKIIYYLNMARMNGPMFVDLYLKDYLKSSGGSRTSFVKSLEETLQNQKSMKPLLPAKDLSAEARTHAEDMGKTGRKGHNSLNGKNLKQRFDPMAGTYVSYGENCDYGNEEAMDIVFSLLIDEDVKALGHRKNMLNPAYNYIGVSIQPHKKEKWNCVMDLGEKK